MSDAKLAIWLPLDVWAGILMLLIGSKAISLRLVTKMSSDKAIISLNGIGSASKTK